MAAIVIGALMTFADLGKVPEGAYQTWLPAPLADQAGGVRIEP